jgi:hypothetical protein
MRLSSESRVGKTKCRTTVRAGRRLRESGFAYLLALFMAVVLIITSQELLENYATRGRRVREQEAIWRGEQVERGIRLYYHKTGHYPQTFDDLQSGMPELHFLREVAMKNPVNQTDGKWRFIYVNAAGQIIGSVKYATLQQMAIMDLNHGKIPPVTPGAVSASTLAGGSNALGSSGLGSNLTTQNGLQLGGSTTAGASSTPTTSGTSSTSGASSDSGQLENPLAALKPTGPVDGPVPGAFLTGVGGVTDAKSLIVYHGGKKYLDWEFIWNPIEDQARAMQAQANGAAGGLISGLTNLPGLPTGLTGTGTSPTGTPATPPGATPTAPAQPTNPAPQPNPNTPQQNSDQ